jgi:general stress protein 26
MLGRNRRMDISSAKSELRDLMKQSEAVYLSSIDETGFPLIRAMLNLRNSRIFPALEKYMDQSDKLYFTTNTSLPKVKQITGNPNVCAYFCIPSEWRGCAVQGTIGIVHDRTVKKALWQESWTMYYPNGIDDPEYTVLLLAPRNIKGYCQLNHYTLAPGDL